MSRYSKEQLQQMAAQAVEYKIQVLAQDKKGFNK